jgi:hypothetical protein
MYAYGTFPQTTKLEIGSSDMEIEVHNVKPNKKIFYFAANPTKTPGKIKSYIDAYKGLKNSGTATASNEGIAKIVLKCPQVYINEDGHVHPRHFHFMYVDTNGLKSRRIHTRHVTCFMTVKPRGCLSLDSSEETPTYAHLQKFLKEKPLHTPIAITGSKINNDKVKRILDKMGYTNTVYV